MPIQFRCSHCGQKLSISRRKAGQEVTCPECVHRIRVPKLKKAPAPAPAAAAPEEENGDSQLRLEVVGQMVDESQSREIWLREINPWLADEEDEEPDFQLGRPRGEEAGLDMTPMVDVTFLLLIFFMITASFSLQKSLETTPPDPKDDAMAQTLTIEDLEENSVVVEIDAEDKMRVDDVPVSSLAELSNVLAGKINAEQKTELLIEADARATHGAVVAVTDIGIDVGMQKVRRASRRSED